MCVIRYQVAKMVRSKFYTPNEVSVHNTMEDLWVSFLGKVYDLTPLCQKFKGGLLNFAILFSIWCHLDLHGCQMP